MQSSAATALLLVAFAAITAADVQLVGLHTQLSVAEDGSFAVVLGSGVVTEASAFEFSGGGPFVHTPDHRFEGVLVPGKLSVQKGSNELGEFEACSQTWTHEDQPLLTTTFKLYGRVSVVEFEVAALQEMRNLSVGNENLQVLSFPSFDVAADEQSRKTYFAVAGNMCVANLVCLVLSRRIER